MSIGNNIRNIRKQKGMTLQQMADIIGCSPQLISQYESGKRHPKLETKKKIADALKCEVSDIDKNIYVISTEYELTPERLERFRKDAEAREIIERYKDGVTPTEEELQKLSEYNNRMHESEPEIQKKRSLMQENLKRLKSLNTSNVNNQLNGDPTETYNDPLSYDNSHSYASSEEEFKRMQDAKQIELEQKRNNDIPKYGTGNLVEVDPETIERMKIENKILNDEENVTEEEWKVITDYYNSEQFRDLPKHLLKAMREDLDILLRIRTTCNKLNAAGQEKVAEHAEMIAKIPEYQKKPDTPPQE